MIERDVVLADVDGKWRPAILLERRGDAWLVACMTSKLHPSEVPRIRISRRHERQWFGNLRLTATSYLYRRNIAVLPRDQLGPALHEGRCPPDLFDQIRTLLLEP